jgi:ABC-2 type transport system ATP-binding protein
MVVMLEVSGVTKRYGEICALDGCTFSVMPKRLVGLLGPNGAGKTTVMRCLLGLAQPDAGTLRWQGEPIGEKTWRRFGYLPEERGLYPAMRVYEQVTHFARLSGMGRSKASRSARDVLDRVGLGGLAERRVEQLSHGNQQRAQLAVALVHEPELLILDEPFAGLDPLGVDTFADLLRALAAEGTAVLFSSHQLDLVQHLCEDVVTMHRGRVVLAGVLEQLRAAGRRRYIDVVFARAADPAFTGRLWHADLVGVDVASADDRHVRLAATPDTDLSAVLRAAQAAGPLLRFDFEPASLEEMFREAVGQ